MKTPKSLYEITGDIKDINTLLVNRINYEYEHALKNLLAMIHGDGGHYVERHGIEKACEDAEEKVAKIFTEYFESKK